MIKAIETSYRGYRFRSRLEARWAVFFDALGIGWEYEPEGFELPDGTRYLPDFWLPDFKLWIEVKPQGPMSEIDKTKVAGLVYGGDAPVYVTHGQPGDLGTLEYTYTQMGGEVNYLSCPAVINWSAANPLNGGMRIWVPIQHSCTEGDYQGSPFFFKESSLGMGEDDQDSEALWWGCRQAVAAAKSARFEFGESGARK